MNNWLFCHISLSILSTLSRSWPRVSKFLLNLLKDVRSDNWAPKWQSGPSSHTFSQTFFAAEQDKIIKSSYSGFVEICPTLLKRRMTRVECWVWTVLNTSVVRFWDVLLPPSWGELELLTFKRRINKISQQTFPSVPCIKILFRREETQFISKLFLVGISEIPTEGGPDGWCNH